MATVWVKRIGGREKFGISFTPGMKFDDLMFAIAEKRKALGHDTGAVLYISSQNSDNEEYECAPDGTIPAPEGEQLGSSTLNPFYFALATSHTGNFAFYTINTPVV